ncbi:MAG: PAS domain S-box protein [Rhizobacter sp.]
MPHNHVEPGANEVDRFALSDAQTWREEQLSRIIDTTMDAVITIDMQQRIRLFNRAASEMFGQDAKEMIGQSLSRLIPDAQRDMHTQHIQRFGEEGTTARVMGEARPLHGVRANGDVFPLEASISRIGIGAATLMTVIARDVTGLRQAEAARRAHALVEAAHRAKADFLSHMSHELRTPLNAVLGLAQLLQISAGDKLSEPEAAQLGQVIAAANRLRALIDDMLDIRLSAPVGRDAPQETNTAEPSGIVLYIEDNEVNAVVVERVLARWSKVRVVVAPDGKTGVQLARTLNPNLVLLDMNLPDITGMEVLELLRHGESTRRLPVVALSANTQPGAVAAALAAGITRYWGKPIDFGPFLDGIEELLRTPAHP